MVVVLNFGSQFAHLIARRVRELGVKSEILPYDTPTRKIRSLNPVGIIFSGSPSSVLEKKAPRPHKDIFNLGIPILGICYGEQIMAQMLGGMVEKGGKRQYGREKLNIRKQEGLFKSLKKQEIVWFSHGDQVTRIPKNFITVASTHSCKTAGMAHTAKKFWGIQFHPEVTHTEGGMQILSNFLFTICKAKKDWHLRDLVRHLEESLRDEIDSQHVVLGISGGVDSLVAASILHRAIGPQLHAVFVDTGLLRKNEVEEVSQTLHAQEFHNLHVIRAGDVFLKRLKGKTDPEEKRKIIGHTFIDVFQKTLKRELVTHPVTFLAQGTIYPDRIESAEPSRHASKIKSHHNLTLPPTLKLKIIEPLKELYKDEVRSLGSLLGLPHKLLWRHPFPGPGLAIRIIGEVTPERLAILKEADAIFRDELERSHEYDKIWQAFAVLLPIKSVGVMGDERTYEYMISLRAVDSVDGMTADWHKMPHELLERISSRIVGSVRGVNRILYDITQKPPATIEYE